MLYANSEMLLFHPAGWETPGSQHIF